MLKTLQFHNKKITEYNYMNPYNYIFLLGDYHEKNFI